MWISSALFALYIVLFFGGAILVGTPERWNRSLPRLYTPAGGSSNLSIGLHFFAGAILLLIGPLQFVTWIRLRAPAFHRWTGRVYILAALTAGVGGLFYIAVAGTVGGWPMSLGFAIYGGLMALCSVQTFRYARLLDFERHRRWAIRLLALVIGSWLYRIEYGFWSLAADEAGMRHNFDGPFDYFMDYFFYLPNLIVAELFIRSRRTASSTGLRVLAGGALLAGSAVVAVGTYYFTRYYWVPPVMQFFKILRG